MAENKELAKEERVEKMLLDAKNILKLTMGKYFFEEGSNLI